MNKEQEIMKMCEKGWFDICLSEIKKGDEKYSKMQREAHNGNPIAQHNLGMWNETVAHKYDEALSWYKKAADQEYQPAKEAYEELSQKLSKEAK